MSSASSSRYNNKPDERRDHHPQTRITTLSALPADARRLPVLVDMKMAPCQYDHSNLHLHDTELEPRNRVQGCARFATGIKNLIDAGSHRCKRHLPLRLTLLPTHGENHGLLRKSDSERRDLGCAPEADNDKRGDLLFTLTRISRRGARRTSFYVF